MVAAAPAAGADAAQSVLTDTEKRHALFELMGHLGVAKAPPSDHTNGKGYEVFCRVLKLSWFTAALDPAFFPGEGGPSNKLLQTLLFGNISALAKVVAGVGDAANTYGPFTVRTSSGGTKEQIEVREIMTAHRAVPPPPPPPPPPRARALCRHACYGSVTGSHQNLPPPTLALATFVSSVYAVNAGTSPLCFPFGRGPHDVHTHT